MKLMIKKKYFDQIKKGEKVIEYRNPVIEFVCEETGETINRDVLATSLTNKSNMPEELQNDNMFPKDYVMRFYLSKGE